MGTRLFDLHLEEACSALPIFRDLCEEALGLQPKQQNMAEKNIHGLCSESVFVAKK